MNNREIANNMNWFNLTQKSLLLLEHRRHFCCSWALTRSLYLSWTKTGDGYVEVTVCCVRCWFCKHRWCWEQSILKWRKGWIRRTLLLLLYFVYSFFLVFWHRYRPRSTCIWCAGKSSGGTFWLSLRENRPGDKYYRSIWSYLRWLALRSEIRK